MKARYAVETKVRAADEWVRHKKDTFKSRSEADATAKYWENRGFHVRVVPVAA